MGSSFARNNSIDNFRNWSCEGAVRITQSCLLHLPDAAARFLFFWALTCAEAHQPVCAEEDRTGGGSWAVLRCEFSHCQSSFRPCWPREWEIYTVNQLHPIHVGWANRSLANELDVKYLKFTEWFRFSQFECFSCLIFEGNLFIQVKCFKIQQGALTSAEINEGWRGLFNLGNEWLGSLILLHSHIPRRLNLVLHTQILFD